MVDPFRMVFINGITSLLLLLGIIIYRYIFPKKKFNLFILLIFISLLPLTSLLRPGAYESGDFVIHTYRTIEFYKSLTEGNILPSWAAGLNATYGYPLFIFNYPLPYYIISLFHFIGFSFINSTKLFLATNFLASGIFMYLYAKKLFKSEMAAFFAAVFYQFAPYHLIDLHFKNVIGEILIFTSLPLTFYSFLQLWEKKNLLWLSLSALLTAILIMSHVVLALFGMVLFFTYAFFLWLRTRKNYYLTSTIIALILGSFCSIYIWITPFFMNQYTIFNAVESTVYFPHIWELLFAPWRFGFLFQGHKGELSFLLGYTHVIVILSIFILAFRKKLSQKIKPEVYFWLSILLITIFFITPYSKFLWDLIPFLKITGSHRLLFFAAFISSILAGYFALYFHKKQQLLLLIIFITVFSTILNWGHRRVIPEITDQTLINTVWQSTSKGEGHFYANSKWRTMKDPWFSKLPNAHLEVVKGTANIKELSRTSTTHIYIVNAQSVVTLKENTLYFPDWQVISNNQFVMSKPDREGVITFILPKGLQLVEIKYDDILIYKILKMISITTIVTLSIAIIVSWRRAYGR